MVFIRGETLSAHCARPQKIPGWIVVVREFFFCNQAGLKKKKIECQNDSVLHTLPGRTMQFSGFGFEGLSVFISYARARSHASLYINIHDLNTQKQTRKWFSFQSMTVLRVIFKAVTITGNQTLIAHRIFLLGASLISLHIYIQITFVSDLWDAETKHYSSQTKPTI